MKILNLFTSLILAFSSCSKTDTVSSFSVSVEIEESHIVSGEYFRLIIEALDTDGIEKIDVEIEEFNYSKTFEINSNTEFSKSLSIQVPNHSSNGEVEIKAKLTDTSGNEILSSSSLKISL